SAVRMKAASRPSSVAAVMRLARRGHGRQEQGRIDEDRIQRDAEVQVRTRDAARGPDLAEQRSGLQVLPGTHVDLAEVTVPVDQARAVTEYHRVAVEEVVAGVDHHTVSGGPDRCAGLGGDIHSRVRVPRLIVEDTP